MSSRFKNWTQSALDAADRRRLSDRLDKQAKVKRPSKYRNEPVVVDGMRFDSKLEAQHYGRLKLAQSVGALKFERQVNFDLTVNGVKVATYRADFVVTFAQDGRTEVQDCKGMLTPEYRLKKKLMLACHGIQIREVYAGSNRKK